MASEAPVEERQERPPLPPRPSVARSDAATSSLQAQATTVVTPLEIQTLLFPDGSRGTFSSSVAPPASTRAGSSGYASPEGHISATSDGGDDSASVTSLNKAARPPVDIASLLVGEDEKKSHAWTLLRSQAAISLPFQNVGNKHRDGLADFESEFEPLPEEGHTQYRDDERLQLWKSKLKHYMIFSAAGKPIWSRHGDLNLINSSVGVIHTIISFYEGASTSLHSFTAGQTKFVVSNKVPLYLVAVTKLAESEAQVLSQLDALYMQVLSTLTLPTLKSIFINRPSSDLRKPLQGTESLLASLADTFTMGSPSALLGALECLRLRKSQRYAINNTFLKSRTSNLLYGILAAGGKLVSVIRPRRHSLHPSDLQLIFNMLFESGGIQTGGGENWIPLCLPAFNSNGYLYMYVSFFEEEESAAGSEPPGQGKRLSGQGIAVVLISAERESFFELKMMRDDLARQLEKTGSLSIIRQAARAGPPNTVDLAPGSQISHFMYKSKANVQFCTSNFTPHFDDLASRRRLMSAYHEMHASMHLRHGHLKILHQVDDTASTLAWVTPVFEFYCVSGPEVTRAALIQGANRIIQWARKDEERLFIIGGGVF